MSELKKTGAMQSRREFLKTLLRGVLLAGLAGMGARALLGRRCQSASGSSRMKLCKGCPDLASCPSAVLSAGQMVWQLDPSKCTQCGRCATTCVHQSSAVKCVHRPKHCGYCRLCFGFFQPGATTLTSAAENQICPTGAIRRKFVEEPYYEYTIDESLCIGCGRCVKGCSAFGNSSLVLQVRHDRCVNCNECAIARNCPSDAFRQVPATAPYLLNPRSESVAL